MDISPVTGLPELPEGYRFNVVRTPYGSGYKIAVEKFVPATQIRRDIPYGPVETFFRRMFKMDLTYLSITIEDEDWKSQVLVPIGGPASAEDRRFRLFNTITPDDVRKFSVVAYERWLAQQHDDEKVRISKSLVGPYPPNSLVVDKTPEDQ